MPVGDGSGMRRGPQPDTAAWKEVFFLAEELMKNEVEAAGAEADEKAECECRHKHRDPKEEKDLINRLNRIEGQIRGIKAMVQDERYCTDILVQVSAVQSALNSFSSKLLSNHIKSCVVQDIKDGREEEAINELCETIKRMM